MSIHVDSSQPRELANTCIKIKKESAAKIILVVASLVLIVLAVGIYFQGAEYIPQVFQTTHRIIDTAVVGCVGLGLAVIALILCLCKKKEMSPPVEVPKPYGVKGCVYTQEDWKDEENEQHFFLIALGGETHEALHDQFMEMYDEEESFKTAVEKLRQSYPEKKAIIYLFDRMTSRLQVGAIGGEIGLKKSAPTWEISFELEGANHASSPSSIFRASHKITAPLFDVDVPVDANQFLLTFEDKIYYI
jgi:hypothetical protein